LILFCEYVIPEEYRAVFAEWTQSHAYLWKECELLENTGQPGVYVEIWKPLNDEEAARTKQERREGRSWGEMEQWVKGGRDGLRIWTFRPMLQQQERVEGMDPKGSV
jgi:hypothetical protein